MLSFAKKPLKLWLLCALIYSCGEAATEGADECNNDNANLNNSSQNCEEEGNEKETEEGEENANDNLNNSNENEASDKNSNDNEQQEENEEEDNEDEEDQRDEEAKADNIPFDYSKPPTLDQDPVTTTANMTLTTPQTSPRNLVAPGYEMVLNGTLSASATVKAYLYDKLVDEVTSDTSFSFTFDDFAGLRGEHSIELVATYINGVEETIKYPIFVDPGFLEQAAVEFLKTYGSISDKGEYRRWQTDSITYANSVGRIDANLKEALTKVTQWTGVTFTEKDVDSAEFTFIPLPDKPNSVSWNSHYTNNVYDRYTYKIGADYGLTVRSLSRYVLLSLGLKAVEEDDATYNGSILDKGKHKHTHLFPFQQAALRLLYSHKPRSKLITPDAILSVTLPSPPEAPMNLVMDGTVVTLDVLVKKAERIIIKAGDTVLKEVPVTEKGLHPVDLDTFGPEGNTSISVIAADTTSEVATTWTMLKDSVQVEKDAREFINKYFKLNGSGETVRWTKETLTIKNNFAGMATALQEAVTWLNARIGLKFEILAEGSSEEGDISGSLDDEVNAFSVGGNSFNGTNLFNGFIKIEDKHKTSPSVIAHELLHAIGVSHFDKEDPKNAGGIMMPTTPGLILYPHQQYGLQMVHRNPTNSKF